ncbi:MAG: EAL domain-containing protein [Neomegalonema sp.]|nr:EAL domain-containing protein [Neomegalonema sp.]
MVETALGADREALGELLLSLERSRRQEVEARALAETLLEGMRVLVAAEHADELYRGVLELLAKVAPVEHAAVLTISPSGALRAVAQTMDGPPLEIAMADQGPFGRALGGRSAALGDLQRVAAWRSADGAWRREAASALVAPLKLVSPTALLVGLHSKRNALTHQHLEAVTRFSDFACAALQRARQSAVLAESIKRVQHAATHDALTGLANRQVLIEQAMQLAEECAEKCCGFSVLHIDLDGFKAINDSLGHAAGDRVLAVVADRLRGAVRADDVCARYGGDEFAILLRSEGDKMAAMRRAEEIRRSISRPIAFENNELCVGASIGVSVFPIDGRDCESLIRASDHALLEAKTEGRNRTNLFTDAMRLRIGRQRQLENGLIGARERGELRLVYQPIYSFRAGGCCGFEALIRWRSPSLGLLPPQEFLPIAETMGLMPSIGQWVLQQACADLAPWLRAGPGRRVAVNVGSAQIVAPNFVADVVNAARAHDLAPSMLELELSEETVVRRTAEIALDNMTELHEKSFQVAFDDFGAGYSSLRHLRSFPGQRLKVDRAFVSGVARSEADRSLVQGLVDLARSLRMEVVAEGVETPEQLAICEAVGCHEIQGFYFSKPLAPSDHLLRASPAVISA